MIKNQKGFTLIELLLYISILAVILLTVSVFLFAILRSQVKNQTIAEVESQGTQVMQIITQSLRNGSLINSPANGVTSPSLSINTQTAGNNPTVFDLASGAIRIKEGAAAAVDITNSRVSVSNLTFQNLNNSVKIQFTITAVNPNNVSEYNYNQTFYGSANLRP